MIWLRAGDRWLGGLVRDFFLFAPGRRLGSASRCEWCVLGADLGRPRVAAFCGRGCLGPHSGVRLVALCGAVSGGCGGLVRDFLPGSCCLGAAPTLLPCVTGARRPRTWCGTASGRLPGGGGARGPASGGLSPGRGDVAGPLGRVGSRIFDLFSIARGACAAVASDCMRARGCARDDAEGGGGGGGILLVVRHLAVGNGAVSPAASRLVGGRGVSRV
jgi:hypothetical protein